MDLIKKLQDSLSDKELDLIEKQAEAKIIAERLKIKFKGEYQKYQFGQLVDVNKQNIIND